MDYDTGCKACGAVYQDRGSVTADAERDGAGHCRDVAGVELAQSMMLAAQSTEGSLEVKAL